MKFQSLLRLGLSKIRKNTPAILTATAVVGVGATAVLAAKAAAKASRLDSVEPERYLDMVDYVKEHWKLYIPAVAAGAATIGAVVMVNHTHQVRYSALMGLFVVGEKAYKELNEAVDELGDDKLKASIKQRAFEKGVHREENQFDDQVAGLADATLCYDNYSGRLFKCDVETIRRAENEFNKGLIHHDYGSLNEFYSLLGVEGIGAGEDAGWNSDQLLAVGINAMLTERGVPVISIDFHDAMPFFNYHSTK